MITNKKFLILPFPKEDEFILSYLLRLKKYNGYPSVISLIKIIFGENTKKIVLAHLSETNNDAQIAINTNKEIIGDKLENIQLLVAMQDDTTETIIQKALKNMN